MPIDIKLLAETTAFHHNCGLNSLVHVLVKNVRRGRIPLPRLVAFCKAFNEYYKSRLSTDTFIKTIPDIKNPVDLEIILGPVLRSMYKLPEIQRDIDVARRDEVLKPLAALDDIEVMAMANFFGIRVESYNSIRCYAIEFLRHRDPHHPLDEKAIQEKIRELRAGPVDLENRDYLEGAHGEQQEERLNVWLGVWFKALGDVPVLRLRHNGAGHFEYEEESQKSKEEHNKFYEEYKRMFPSDKFPRGFPDLDALDAGGFPNPHSLDALQAKISAALNGPAAAINLSAVMAAHKRACLERPHAPRRAGGAAGPKGASPGGFLKGFSDPFGGAGKSNLGGRLADAMLSAFKGVGGSPSTAGSSKTSDKSDKTGISSMPWVQILEGVCSFIMNLANGLSGLSSTIPEIQRTMDPSLDLNQSDFDQHPEAELFAEYAGKLPLKARKALNVKWTDCVKNNQDTDGVMLDLIKALRSARKYEDANELAFNYKVDKVSDPVHQQHLSEQWQRINKEFSGDQRSRVQQRMHRELDALIESAPPVVFAKKNPLVAHRPGKGPSAAAAAAAAGAAAHAPKRRRRVI